MATPLFEMQQVHLSYTNGFTLDPVNLTLSRGTLCLISGPSGAGKTTLLKLMTAELNPLGGKRLFLARDITRPDPAALSWFRRQIGIVRQELSLLQDRSVLQNLLFRFSVLGIRLNQHREKPHQLLGRFRLQHRTHALPGELSAGERRRAELACAMVGSPQIVFADEPLANLDQANKQNIVALLLELLDLGTTVVMATHDSWALELPATHKLLLKRGRLQ
ncbi:MAG: ATP-binding cassette domain-containing protein [Candidatus Delongbacteria bacterium]|nr:ATP-binding cassette domain-containing protein [bacterium]MBL7033248.1 ATP-binding cassette domain-containing protein [Candidatus Delongbacteria bacterium]